jgi:phenylpropionate dioxygenase-like ring-hydroxylating dioxygenase large terminal subunit
MALSQRDNELLTRVGPGTPAGALFRRYWIPALHISDLSEPDGPPVRVKLLGERLLAFRDSEGRVGLVEEFCAHRRVSLWFGRNEENGLRCPYHGWKYDVDGNCTEIPSEPPDSGMCSRVRLTAYPCIEQGGLIWTYMGPPELKPEPPEIEWSLVPDEQRYISKRLQESNYLQAMEGGIDSSHVAFLHSDALRNDPLIKGSKSGEYYRDKMPHFEVVDFDGGVLIGVRRKADEGRFYWRITPWLAPMFNLVPPRGNHPIHGHAWVPIDDETCWVWNISFHPRRPLTTAERAAMRAGSSIHTRVIPGTYIPEANSRNDYQMDRNAQVAGMTYSGVYGVGMQDASLQESMGPIVDRSRENLVGTDNGIIMVRRALLRAIRANQEGKPIPGLGASQRVASCGIELPADAKFPQDAMHALRRERFVDPVSV